MQFGQLKRREFITLLGGAAAAWPLAARAQQAHVPVVGVLRPNRQDVLETFAEPFRRYMKAIGWEEGRNIRFQFAWMGGRNERATASYITACPWRPSSPILQESDFRHAQR